MEEQMVIPFSIQTLLVYFSSLSLTFIICFLSSLMRCLINVIKYKKKIVITHPLIYSLFSSIVVNFLIHLYLNKLLYNFNVYVGFCFFVGMFSREITLWLTNGKNMSRIIKNIFKNVSNPIAKGISESLEEIEEEKKEKDKEKKENEEKKRRKEDKE